MKRLLFISFILLHFAAKAQLPTQIINFPEPKYVFVGSLIMADNSSANSQKIVVKIFGGGWFGDSNGETNYYISNRGGFSIRQVSLGGSVTTQIPLKAYQNGIQIDFYIVPSVDVYSSFAVSSFSYGFGLTPQYVNIAEQTTVPVGTDITSTVQIISTIATDGAGRVGIGTATPSEALSVKGKIRAQEIKVEHNNWPDYVFANDYRLSTLQETEKHINEKGHLPGIPSAAEVKVNGIDLGEMNATLLQKIEELTLHLINIKKESDEIKQVFRKQGQVIENQKKDIEYLKLKLK